MKVHPSESRADTRRYALSGCAAGFFRHGSGVQWDSRKTAPGDKNHQGPGHAAWRTGAWISLVRLRPRRA